MASNDEYIDKSSDMVTHLFNKTCLCRYPCSRKVIFDNTFEFNQYFAPLLKEFDIKPILPTVKKPQSNALLDRVHQLIINMLVTKDLDKTFFIHIDPWGEILAYIEWAIRASYHRNMMSTSVQTFFVRYLFFKLASVL